jgi:hypothetical protein
MAATIGAVYTWTEPDAQAAAAASPTIDDRQPHGRAAPSRGAESDQTLTPALPTAFDRYLQAATFSALSPASLERAKFERAGFPTRVFWTSRGHYVVALGPFASDDARLRVRDRFLAAFPGYEAQARSGDMYDAVMP